MHPIQNAAKPHSYYVVLFFVSNSKPRSFDFNKRSQTLEMIIAHVVRSSLIQISTPHNYSHRQASVHDYVHQNHGHMEAAHSYPALLLCTSQTKRLAIQQIAGFQNKSHRFSE